ncbi:CoA-transferase [Novosphingobium sp. AAP83]|uniref:CaiB/BaiF CoA transferase family protein n=1 Tax=Novosphingobium sp. AAP83 TaxID=1523425 RepID=UPI0006B89177|nr:CoA transferase [Novosphingobium sp. AAP83]KPF92411.1 CoA-transferase [Novosphingobium sp. AAP83]
MLQLQADDTTTVTGARPLDGVTVLDLGRILAAPWATQILADLGAQVIKIERPVTGDDTRAWGPPFAQGHGVDDAAVSGYFLAANRGKKSVAVDISTPQGQELVRNLAARCDVVVENFKVGDLARFGLDAASMRKAIPGLIYCSVTGFGQDGPRHEQAAYDFAIQAMGGIMSVTGERADLPGGGAQKVGIPVVDLMTGMYAAVAILAALNRKAATGAGETIDLAMFDVAAAMLGNQAMNFLLTGRPPTQGGNRHPNIQPQDVFACSDGDIVLAVGNDRQFAKLCGVLGRDEWALDSRFKTNAARVAASAELTGLLLGAFAAWSRADLVRALEQSGVPCAPVNNIAEFFDDPQIAHRQMIRRLEAPGYGEIPQVVSPMRFSDAPLRFDVPAPRLGEHTAEILAAAGIQGDALVQLEQDGVVCT